MTTVALTLLFPPAFIGSGVALFWNPLAGARAAWLTLAIEIAVIVAVMVKYA